MCIASLFRVVSYFSIGKKSHVTFRNSLFYASSILSNLIFVSILSNSSLYRNLYLVIRTFSNISLIVCHSTDGNEDLKDILDSIIDNRARRKEKCLRFYRIYE